MKGGKGRRAWPMSSGARATVSSNVSGFPASRRARRSLYAGSLPCRREARWDQGAGARGGMRGGMCMEATASWVGVGLRTLPVISLMSSCRCSHPSTNGLPRQTQVEPRELHAHGTRHRAQGTVNKLNCTTHGTRELCGAVQLVHAARCGTND